MQSHVGTAFILAKPIGWRRSNDLQSGHTRIHCLHIPNDSKMTINTLKFLIVDGLD